MASQPPPPWFATGPLAEFWNRPVRELADVELPDYSPAERERHKIYSLLAMALVYQYWNGNKRGAAGEYPWRKDQRLPTGLYAGGDYLGHNIASIAVDGHGRVIDFDFNHNELFCSSVEHAESRLVRRLFSLAQLRDDWRPALTLSPAMPGDRYTTILQDVSIYTTLEPCAQCAGIMALGRVREIVYLQRDPDMYLVAHLLRNLTRPDFRAPLPVHGEAFGFKSSEALNSAYPAFVQRVQETPFYVAPGGTQDTSSAITSFLCTDEAKEIFYRASQELMTVTLAHGGFRPTPPGLRHAGLTLDNQEVLLHSRQFLEYAITRGRRGTPHRQ